MSELEEPQEEQSRRTLRGRGAARARAQRARVVRLNLVSLMDVFTILVFFLLVNSSDVQPPSSQVLRLPVAKAVEPVTESLVISANAASVAVQGRKIAETSQALATPDVVIDPLLDELRYQFERSSHDRNSSLLPSATVMADREVPFALLHRIMATASRAGYGQVSLAVIGEPVGSR